MSLELSKSNYSTPRMSRFVVMIVGAFCARGKIECHKAVVEKERLSIVCAKVQGARAAFWFMRRMDRARLSCSDLFDYANPQR